MWRFNRYLGGCDRTFFLFPKKTTNLEAESGAITNAKGAEGLGRSANRRPFKTRYMRSKILNFMILKERERSILGGQCKRARPRNVMEPRRTWFTAGQKGTRLVF